MGWGSCPTGDDLLQSISSRLRDLVSGHRSTRTPHRRGGEIMALEGREPRYRVAFWAADAGCWPKRGKRGYDMICVSRPADASDLPTPSHVATAGR